MRIGRAPWWSGIAPALAAAGLLLGCGYALVGRASTLPADIRAVYVAPLENQTTRAQLEQFLTQAITDELVTRRRFTIVRSAAEAQAQLVGAVTSFRVTPVTFDESGRAQEYEISILAAMRFVRTGTGDEEVVVWENDRYLFRETYEIEASAEDFFDRENEAIAQASLRFAETMVADLLEGF
ncbi:MAG TPA: LPS assembly lipoprotein LptE [Thermoanaerobaculia bacterium]|nr:LPS assembly lipoprotein LptE [Thermoanaerobaculia bacterium]